MRRFASAPRSRRASSSPLVTLCLSEKLYCWYMQGRSLSWPGGGHLSQSLGGLLITEAHWRPPRLGLGRPGPSGSPGRSSRAGLPPSYPGWGWVLARGSELISMPTPCERCTKTSPHTAGIVLYRQDRSVLKLPGAAVFWYKDGGGCVPLPL